MTCRRYFSAPVEPCAKFDGHRGRCLRRSALERAIREAERERCPADLATLMLKDAERKAHRA